MIAGGTLNTRVFQNDLNQIQSGQFYSPTLIRLPLLQTFHQTAGSAAAPYGGRPDLATDTTRNPIVGNVATSKGILSTRIQIQEPANCLQLLWHALDPGGNYQCSYPLNSPTNVDATSHQWQTSDHWAFGWIRLNGLGLWFPMSLQSSTSEWAGSGGAFPSVLPYGGFSSIAAPMSFIDWVGFWDGGGDVVDGPMGGNAFILAVSSVNLSVSSNGGTLGNVANYATPSGSGTEAQPPTTDTQRSQDVLVRSGGNGR